MADGVVPRDPVSAAAPFASSLKLKGKRLHSCCTGNQARLLPNYIHHSWMGTPDGGLAATMYAPVTVRSSVGDVTVEISSKTSYPFEDTVIMDVTLVDSAAASFPLWLRIPAWW